MALIKKVSVAALVRDVCSWLVTVPELLQCMHTIAACLWFDISRLSGPTVASEETIAMERDFYSHFQGVVLVVCDAARMGFVVR